MPYMEEDEEQLIQFIKVKIQRFPWGNYGMDIVEQAESDEWAFCLAQEIANGLVHD